MGKIFCLMGKSSSGKDTIFKELNEDKEDRTEQFQTFHPFERWGNTRNSKAGNLSWSEWFGKDIVYGSDEPLL